MLERYRFALAPRWAIGHVLVVAAAITMVFLGRWQLHVSESKGFSLQNFGYAFQWWAFSIFAVAMWGKILHDVVSHRAPADGGARPVSRPAPAPVGFSRAAAGSGPAGAAPGAAPAVRSYRPPQVADVAATLAADPGDARDPIHDYNAYLAALAEKDRR